MKQDALRTRKSTIPGGMVPNYDRVSRARYLAAGGNPKDQYKIRIGRTVEPSDELQAIGKLLVPGRKSGYYRDPLYQGIVLFDTEGPDQKDAVEIDLGRDRAHFVTTTTQKLPSLFGHIVASIGSVEVYGSHRSPVVGLNLVSSQLRAESKQLHHYFGPEIPTSDTAHQVRIPRYAVARATSWDLAEKLKERIETIKPATLSIRPVSPDEIAFAVVPYRPR